MGQKLVPPPHHPAIKAGQPIFKTTRPHGGQEPGSDVECPGCHRLKWTAWSHLRFRMKRPGVFTGYCQRCRLSYRGPFREDARNPGARTGVGTPGFLGAHGYVRLSRLDVDPADDRLFVAMQGRSHTVVEHRFAMAKYLGRPLEKWENVHHRNGDRRDNRIENLELWITRQPKGQDVEDQVRWAREILRRYRHFRQPRRGGGVAVQPDLPLAVG